MSALVGPYEAELLDRYARAHSRLTRPPKRQEIPPPQVIAFPAPKREQVNSGEDWVEMATSLYDYGPFYVGDIYEDVKNPFLWRRIIEEVAEKHKMDVAEMLSKRRFRPLVKARGEAMCRLKHETNLTFGAIGRKMGGRDHTTVLSAIARHERLLARGEAL